MVAPYRHSAHLATTPRGCVPALVWSTHAPSALAIHEDHLIWAIRGGASSVWRCSIHDIDAMRAQRISGLGMPTLDEWISPTCIAAKGSDIYVGHVDGVARFTPQGDAYVATALDSPPIFRLSVVGPDLIGLGEVMPEREGGDTVHLTRFRDNVATEIARLPGSFDSTVSISRSSRDGCAWVVADSRLYRYRADSVVPCCRSPLLRAAEVVHSGVYGVLVEGGLVRLDPASGAVLDYIADCPPGPRFELLELGEWLAFAISDLCGVSELCAVRTDGAALQTILRSEGRILDLCSDGRRIYWADDAAACICGIPIGPTGILAPMAPAPPTRVEAPWLSPGNIADLPELAAPDRAGDSMGAVVSDALLALSQGDPIQANEHRALMPWVGWLMLGVLFHRKLQGPLVACYAGRTFLRQDQAGCLPPDAQYSVICDRLYPIDDSQLWMCLRLVNAGDDIHMIVDPRWFSPRAFAESVAATRDEDDLHRRVWRWLPSMDLIELAAQSYVVQLGGELEEGVWGAWARLPTNLEALVGPVSAISLAPISHLASRVGDHELALEADPHALTDLYRCHRWFVDSLIDAGELAVIDALPQLRFGAELTVACDRLLAARGGDRHSVARVVEILSRSRETPSSQFLRRLLVQVTAKDDASSKAFAAAVPYLVQRMIDGDLLTAKVRLLAGLDQIEVSPVDRAVTAETVMHGLLVDHSAGRMLAHRTLEQGDAWAATEVATLLTAIGASWCAEVLRSARCTSPARDGIEDALRLLEPQEQCTGEPGATGEHVVPRLNVDRWRRRLEQLAPVQLAALRAQAAWFD